MQLAFAEALRLLRELAAHLDPNLAAPLPAVPFPGQQTTLAEASEAVGQPDAPPWPRSWATQAERRVVSGQPQLADYVTRPGERLFARLHALDARPVVYLAGQPEDFVDPQHLAMQLEPADTAVSPPGLGTRACLDGPDALPHLMALRAPGARAGRAGWASDA